MSSIENIVEYKCHRKVGISLCLKMKIRKSNEKCKTVCSLKELMNEEIILE